MSLMWPPAHSLPTNASSRGNSPGARLATRLVLYVGHTSVSLQKVPFFHTNSLDGTGVEKCSGVFMMCTMYPRTATRQKSSGGYEVKGKP